MKHLKDKLKAILLKDKERKSKILLFSKISRLSESKLQVHEIELFLAVDFKSFDDAFFKRYFYDYYNLLKYLNPLRVMVYISFQEGLKKSIQGNLFKKLLYPTLILMMSFLVLIIFKGSLMSLLSDLTSPGLEFLINTLYYLSVIIIILIVAALLFSLFYLRRKDLLILGFNRMKRWSLFRLLELYYLKVFTFLLMICAKEGMSTLETFTFINRVKHNHVISNIAYFINSNLEDGQGIQESIQRMNVNERFKSVLLYSLESENYHHFMMSFDKQLSDDISNEISKLSRCLYVIAYIYIGCLLILFYYILMLPLSLINTL